jgi:hypothetical protein
MLFDGPHGQLTAGRRVVPKTLTNLALPLLLGYILDSYVHAHMRVHRLLPLADVRFFDHL